jgi:methylated-DNA-[protein]-cysteine S-methyltransferase
MSPDGFAFFDTPLGVCGIAWRNERTVRLGLPAGDVGRLRSRFQGHYPEWSEQQPPPAIQAAIDAVVAHLAGRNADLERIEIDLDGVQDFEGRVYQEARRIPSGSTRTYGDIADALGAPGAAQAVGQALAANPIAIIVPCHRVVAGGGKIGGFSAAGGADTKRRILRIEGSEMGATQEVLFEP